MQNVRIIFVDKAQFVLLLATDQPVSVHMAYWVIHSQVVLVLPINVHPRFHVLMVKYVLADAANIAVIMLFVVSVPHASHIRVAVSVDRISLEILNYFVCHVSI